MSNIKLKTQFLKLEPAGLGTQHVESLSGYLARFSEHNRCKLSDVLKYGEELSGVKLPRQRCGVTIAAKQIGNIHTYSSVRDEFLECVSRATRVSKERLKLMTFQSFEHLFNNGTARKSVWWNPNSYTSERNTYERLFWQMHGVYIDKGDYLETRCNCGKTQPVIGLTRKVNQCIKCEGKLERYNYEAPTLELNEKRSIRDPNLKPYLEHYAELASGFLAFGAKAETFDFSSSFRQIYDKSYFSTFTEAEQRLGINHVTLKKWYYGERPKFGYLIRLLYSYNLEPAEFFQQQHIHYMADTSWVTRKSPELKLPQQTKRERVDHELVNNTILKDIKRGYNVNISISEYCKSKLGHPYGSLQRYSRTLLNNLSELKAANSNATSTILRSSRIAMIKQAAKICIERQECVNYKNIGKLLRFGGFIEDGKDGFLMDSWARDLIKKLNEEGCSPRMFC